MICWLGSCWVSACCSGPQRRISSSSVHSILLRLLLLLVAALAQQVVCQPRLPLQWSLLPVVVVLARPLLQRQQDPLAR